MKLHLPLILCSLPLAGCRTVTHTGQDVVVTYGTSALAGAYVVAALLIVAGVALLRGRGVKKKMPARVVGVFLILVSCLLAVSTALCFPFNRVTIGPDQLTIQRFQLFDGEKKTVVAFDGVKSVHVYRVRSSRTKRKTRRRTRLEWVRGDGQIVKTYLPMVKQTLPLIEEAVRQRGIEIVDRS